MPGGRGRKEADCLCRRLYWLNWCRGARLSPAAREQGPAVPVCRLCLFASCAVHRPSLELPHQARRCPSLRSWLLRRHTRSCTLQPCPTLAPHNLNPWPRPVCRSRGEGSCEARNLSLAHNFSMENATQRVCSANFLRSRLVALAVIVLSVVM